MTISIQFFFCFDVYVLSTCVSSFVQGFFVCTFLSLDRQKKFEYPFRIISTLISSLIVSTFIFFLSLLFSSLLRYSRPTNLWLSFCLLFSWSVPPSFIAKLVPLEAFHYSIIVNPDEHTHTHTHTHHNWHQCKQTRHVDLQRAEKQNHLAIRNNQLNTLNTPMFDSVCWFHAAKPISLQIHLRTTHSSFRYCYSFDS